jgi:hypothetical protein
VNLSSKRITKSFLESRPYKVVYLLGTVLFAKPEDFALRKGVPRPRYARHKWISTLPLIPATIFANALKSFFIWLGFHQQTAIRTTDVSVDQFLSYVDYISYGMIAGLAALTYAFAFLRWAFHRALASRWMVSDGNVFVAPYRYFIVNTSAGAIWFALYSSGVLWLMRRFGVDFRQGLAEVVQAHPSVTVAAFLALGIVIRLSSANRRKGMIAVYGGVERRLHMADGIIFIMALVGLVSIMATHTGA